MSLQNGWQTISLIILEAIQIHLEDNFHFTRSGLVQVAVKPFMRKGINVPIYMALGDKRLKKYKSCLWAMTDTGIQGRPNSFNCYPEFCADFSCPMMPKALKLDVHIQGGEFHNFKNFKNYVQNRFFIIVYKPQYKTFAYITFKFKRNNFMKNSRW